MMVSVKRPFAKNKVECEEARNQREAASMIIIIKNSKHKSMSFFFINSLPLS